MALGNIKLFDDGGTADRWSQALKNLSDHYSGQYESKQKVMQNARGLKALMPQLSDEEARSLSTLDPKMQQQAVSQMAEREKQEKMSQFLTGLTQSQSKESVSGIKALQQGQGQERGESQGESIYNTLTRMPLEDLYTLAQQAGFDPAEIKQLVDTSRKFKQEQRANQDLDIKRERQDLEGQKFDHQKQQASRQANQKLLEESRKKYDRATPIVSGANQIKEALGQASDQDKSLLGRAGATLEQLFAGASGAGSVKSMIKRFINQLPEKDRAGAKDVLLDNSTPISVAMQAINDYERQAQRDISRREFIDQVINENDGNVPSNLDQLISEHEKTSEAYNNVTEQINQDAERDQRAEETKDAIRSLVGQATSSFGQQDPPQSPPQDPAGATPQDQAGMNTQEPQQETPATQMTAQEFMQLTPEQQEQARQQIQQEMGQAVERGREQAQQEFTQEQSQANDEISAQMGQDLTPEQRQENLELGQKAFEEYTRLQDALRRRIPDEKEQEEALNGLAQAFGLQSGEDSLAEGLQEAGTSPEQVGNMLSDPEARNFVLMSDSPIVQETLRDPQNIFRFLDASRRQEQQRTGEADAFWSGKYDKLPEPVKELAQKTKEWAPVLKPYAESLAMAATTTAVSSTGVGILGAVNNIKNLPNALRATTVALGTALNFFNVPLTKRTIAGITAGTATSEGIKYAGGNKALQIMGSIAGNMLITGIGAKRFDQATTNAVEQASEKIPQNARVGKYYKSVFDVAKKASDSKDVRVKEFANILMEGETPRRFIQGVEDTGSRIFADKSVRDIASPSYRKAISNFLSDPKNVKAARDAGIIGKGERVSAFMEKLIDKPLKEWATNTKGVSLKDVTNYRNAVDMKEVSANAVEGVNFLNKADEFFDNTSRRVGVGLTSLLLGGGKGFMGYLGVRGALKSASVLGSVYREMIKNPKQMNAFREMNTAYLEGSFSDAIGLGEKLYNLFSPEQQDIIDAQIEEARMQEEQ